MPASGSAVSTWNPSGDSGSFVSFRPVVNAAIAVLGPTLEYVREWYGADSAVLEFRAELDGLTVDLPDGSWFNLRASNTEPLLRLNVEAPDEARMASLRDRVLEMVRA